MMETPMLNNFYRTAGADVDMSANVANTIREFDLVKIGVDADITGSIITHLVTPQGVIMHNVHIGAACKVDSKAMISPNCTMEDGSTLKKCEIAQAGTTIKAPAEPRQADQKAAIKLQVCQLFCNLLCGLVFMGTFISPPATALATSVRMSSVWGPEGAYFMDAMRWVSYYMVFLWTMGALLLAWSVVFKWVFIGKLKDGHVCQGMWWDLRVFMLNYWWTLCYMFFLQYWIDCTLLAITCYNLFGAKVSYRTGLRFLQNMNPWHADFMTIKDGANMSNAKLHPSTPEKNNVLKNIVLEENTFVGLMSLISGGVTLHKGSAVATTTKCTEDVQAGQTLIGQKLMGDAKKDKGGENMDFSQITALALAGDLAVALGLRVVVNAGFIFFLACTVSICFVANDFLPIVLVIPVAFVLASFFLGVAYAKTMETLLHPRIVADLTIGQDWKAMTWLQYLQALYLSQAYTFSMVNGSAVCAAMHKILGADTPLDAQWYSTAIRDQCLLKVGHNSVIDSSAYLVGHVGQPGGVLSFKKAGLGDNCTLHPGSIILSGQQLKSGSTLDLWSHSHIEKVLPENKFYTGNPASAEVNSRVNKIAAALQ
jgi:UDP-3-O-[3-hydroxymyristoyl] glucosamine N-acyltransferase